MQEQNYDNKGYVQISRELFSGPMWSEKRKYSKCEAWIDLVQSARYGNTPAREIMGGKVVTWSKGQLPASYRYLSGRWTWSVEKVIVFIKFLVAEEWITTSQNGGQTIIEIRSFSTASKPVQQIEHQPVQQPVQPNPIQLGVSEDHQYSLPDENQYSKSNADQYNIEERKNKVKKKEEVNTCAITQEFETFWSLYDKKVGRVKAEKLWKALSDEDRAKAITHAPLYAQTTPDKQFRQHPATYLGSKSFEDELFKTDLPATTGKFSGGNRKNTGTNELLDSLGDDLRAYGGKLGTSEARTATAREW